MTTPEAIADITEAAKLLEAMGSETPVAMPRRRKGKIYKSWTNAMASKPPQMAAPDPNAPKPLPSVVIGHVAITRHDAAETVAALKQAIDMLDDYATKTVSDSDEGFQLSTRLTLALARAKTYLAKTTLANRRLTTTMRRKDCMPLTVDSPMAPIGSRVEGGGRKFDERIEKAGIESWMLNLRRVDPEAIADLLYLIAEPRTKTLFAREAVIAHIKHLQAEPLLLLRSTYLERPGVVEALKKMHAKVPRD